MFARMRAAIGEAAAIAARAALSQEERRAVRSWLTPLEAMARKIVLIHALALARAGDIHPRTTFAKLAPAPGVRARHPAPPAVTLITLPPPVRVLSHAAAAPAATPRPRSRARSLRLWPRASLGAREYGLAQPTFHRHAAAREARSRKPGIIEHSACPGFRARPSVAPE
jgi:hypothetical protein